MAPFPELRSGRDASGTRAPGESAGEQVAHRLREIAAESDAPEDALEPALRAILAGCGAAAGAICLFDARTEVLRLAAEIGLSDEGCRQLRSVRRGGIGSWDMPLHSLLNRRAYLIESAARNRYVPPLVEPATQVRTLACVPLFAGQTPLASLLLIALLPQSISERDIRALDPALRELIRMIEAVRRRAPGAATPVNGSAAAPAPSRPNPPSAPTSTPASLAQSSASAANDGVAPSTADGSELAARLAEALARAQAAEEARAAALAEAEAARTAAACAQEAATQAAQLLTAAKEARAAALAERDRLREAVAASEALAHRLTVLEAELARERERAAALEERGAEATRQAETLAAALEAEQRRAQAAEEARDRAQRAADDLLSSLEATPPPVEGADNAHNDPEAAVAVPDRATAKARVADHSDLPRAEPVPAEGPATPPPILHPMPVPAAGPEKTVLVLDALADWQHVAANGHALHVHRPGDPLPPPSGDAAATVLANLAIDEVLEAIARIRSGGAPPVRGFVAPSGSPTVLPLGIVEVAARPLDPELLIQRLAGLKANGMRVVTVGSDVDAFFGVRQALGRQGMSVSMAWNAKQGDDLLGMVKPHVLIVDLDLPQRDGFAIVARAAQATPPPVLVVLPGREPPGPRFAALLADPALAGRLVGRAALLADVGRPEEQRAAGERSGPKKPAR